MEYRTEIWVSYNYGGWSIVYSKVFDLPFVPFYGVGIIFDDKKEYKIILENNDFCTTIISYNIEKNQFDVNIRYDWKYPTSNETIDFLTFKFSEWKKQYNSTDIDELKKIMKKDLDYMEKMEKMEKGLY
jgi:hypothetical protein